MVKRNLANPAYAGVPAGGEGKNTIIVFLGGGTLMGSLMNLKE